MPVLSQGGLARHGVPAVVWREGLAGLRVPVRSVLWLAHRHTSQGCRYTRPAIIGHSHHIAPTHWSRPLPFRPIGMRECGVSGQ